MSQSGCRTSWQRSASRREAVKGPRRGVDQSEILQYLKSAKEKIRFLSVEVESELEPHSSMHWIVFIPKVG